MNTNIHPIIEAALIPFINNTKKVKTQPAKVKFILSRKIKSITNSSEYVYLIEVTSITGNKYTTCDTWHGYGINAKEAKQMILDRIAQTQSIDYVMDDIIINNPHGTPYFVQVS